MAQVALIGHSTP